jgi:hypothetical protein
MGTLLYTLMYRVISALRKDVGREARGVTIRTSSEDTLLAVRRTKAINAVKLIQQQSIKNGLDKITLEEINSEIKMSRQDRKK